MQAKCGVGRSKFKFRMGSGTSTPAIYDESEFSPWRNGANVGLGRQTCKQSAGSGAQSSNFGRVLALQPLQFTMDLNPTPVNTKAKVASGARNAGKVWGRALKVQVSDGI